VTNRSPLFGTDWDRLLNQEFSKSYWSELLAFIEDERQRFTVYPPRDDVLNAFKLTSYAETKVVILGQDPYPGHGEAHGLAFSVPCGVPRPPSLKNIYKELNKDLSVPIPDHGNLEQWARRGVLLLNATLTVRDGSPGSHRRKGWETFTDEVIRALNRKAESVVFVLWGRIAEGKKALIDSPPHTVIKSPSPSPLAAWRGFFGSRPFSRANDALVAARREGINWTVKDCRSPK
jgi:uracil-DNA glycosylase